MDITTIQTLLADYWWMILIAGLAIIMLTSAFESSEENSL